MNYLNGGYAMIKHNASQKDLANAYKTNKPVLVYDENQKAHWGQINEKAIETIDEETEETITTYEYSYQLLNDITSLVDSAGNSRFIEGDITTNAISNIKYTYKKWSLSGTHLMIVLAGEATANATIETNQEYGNLVLPPFIRSKIATLTPEGRISSSQLWSFVAYEATSLKNISLVSYSADGPLSIIGWATGNFTIPKGTFRLQFDLLIDADYSE